MSIEEIKSLIEKQGSAFDEFKKVNDQRLAEIEKKGSADPLLDQKLDKISASLDEYKERQETLEKAMNRPGATATEGKDDKNAYSNAFKSFARRGIETPEFKTLMEKEEKALSVVSDPDGGYLVTPQMSSNIIKAVYESTPMRQLASIETISTDSLDIINDVNEASAGWVGETASISETNTPQIGKSNIPVRILYAQPKATQKILDDASIDIESWLAGKIAEKFARVEATAFISGDGVSAPRGLLTYAAGTSWGQIQQVSSGSSGAVTADSLINVFYTLKDAYSANASFLMNRTTVALVRLLKDSTNQYLWQPGLASGQPDTLLGRPVYMANDMPVAATNSLSIAVGDFKQAYQIVDRIGIRTLRDPFTEKPYVKFYTTKRVGGDVVNFEAVKLLKLA